MPQGVFTPGLVNSDVGNFAATTQYLTGDFNKDGIPDLIQISQNTATNKYNASNWINNGAGSFSLSSVPSVIGNYEITTQYLSVDINNDGFTDLIEIWKNGTTNKFQSATWLNNGQGSFYIGPETTNIGNFATNTKYLNADVNKDGFADLIQISQNTTTNKYTATTWINNSQGSFNVGPVTSSIGNYETTTQYLTGDFNKDGVTDLIEIWKNGTTNKFQSATWLNNGQGSFYLGLDTTNIGNYAANTQYLSADINKDGATDLIEIWQNGTKFGSTTWLNNGQGSFYLGTTNNDVGNYAANTKYLISDVNKDGSSDLIQIFQNGTKFSAATWLNSDDTVIESAGNTSLIKDGANKYYAQAGNTTPITIKNGGQQIYQNIYPGWQTLAAETVNGQNQVLWKNIAGNYLHLWKLDSNWNFTSSEGQFALNSSDALTQESNFQIDANGDGKIGYAIIENSGNTTFLKDATNKYYAQTGNTTPIAIKNGGQQIYQNIYAGWQTLATETVNGQNQVLWKNIAGNYLHLWKLDSNWNFTSSEGQFALNSSDALTQETNFQIDANGDGQIGYAIIENAGNSIFLKDATNKYYAKTGNTTPVAIKNGGQQIYQDIYSADWKTLAVENVNGQNQVLWKNISGNYLHLWKLDSNWNFTSSEGQFALNSPQALTQEANFQIDLNGDGLINIETAGNSPLSLGVNGYLLNNNILLKYNGNGVTDKTFDSASEDWNLLGAEKTGTGYQGMWRSSLGSYSLWNTDNLGNYLSSTSGLLAGIVAYETTFAQDFNNNGAIGS
jgi:hypothetical protein